MNLEFGLWTLDFFDGLVGDDPQSVPTPVLQLDHDTLPGHGGEAIVGNTLGIGSPQQWQCMYCSGETFAI